MFHRIIQIGYALRFRTPPVLEPELIPEPPVRRLFEALGAHDQRHLLEVFRKCREAGLPEHICQGGLLHDIGKSRLSGSTMSVAGRTWHVLFGRYAPHWERKLADFRLPIISNELTIAFDHARIGAERMCALGVSTAVTDVIRHHDDPHVTDPALRTLQKIDSATP
jgi:hypothetical protein